MAIKPVSVSMLNEYIGKLISTDPLLCNVVVKGEITSIKYHGTGHVYFSISDNKSKINCFLAKQRAMNLTEMLSDGDEVTLTGSVSVYQKGGYYSLNVTGIEIEGEGALAAEFVKIKARLEKEGLFDSKHKKKLPEFPKHIGVVTSETGAAVKDILAIIQARTKLTNVSIFPVSVQGDRASSEISHMIDFLSDTRSEDIDLLIVGRGGGSPEDLMVFNSEELARSIYACNIPVISAVGHEIDFTISDFVADVRAETPTAAAELAVPDMNLLYEKINKLHEDISLNLSNRLMYDDIRIKNIYDSISHILTNKIQSYENTLNRLALLLSENNPRAILERGYSILSDEKGMPIANVSKLKIKASYKLNLSDGSANCKIYDISEDVNYGRQ
mgnify:FL=1